MWEKCEDFKSIWEKVDYGCHWLCDSVLSMILSQVNLYALLQKEDSLERILLMKQWKAVTEHKKRYAAWAASSGLHTYLYPEKI